MAGLAFYEALIAFQQARERLLRRRTGRNRGLARRGGFRGQDGERTGKDQNRSRCVYFFHEKVPQPLLETGRTDKIVFLRFKDGAPFYGRPAFAV